MNDPHFAVFPEFREGFEGGVTMPGGVKVTGVKVPTGKFVWHFQDSNGRITHIGGESFTRREDAHRSIKNVAMDYFALSGGSISSKTALESLPIVDLDEKGQPIK
jgi:uncharacterized protein YegP (UPF0339 family)